MCSVCSVVNILILLKVPLWKLAVLVGPWLPKEFCTLRVPLFYITICFHLFLFAVKLFLLFQLFAFICD